MRVVVGIWLLLVTLISFAPDSIKAALGSKGQWHYALHLAVFFITGLLILGASVRLSLWLRAALLVIFCFMLELLEALLYHNPIEWRDVLVDIGGIALAWACLRLIRSRQTARTETGAAI